ncbi:MAG: alpha/beta hydrolase [Thermodesulfobacteriota bacterium]
MPLTSEINGRQIGYQTGSGGLRPGLTNLILIHGSGGTREDWTYQLEGLDQDLNVIALELPGHGLSDGPLPPTVAEYAAWTAGVIQAWDLPKKPLVAGHSLGGAICIELGLTRPELLSGLVIIGSGARLAVNPALFEGLAKDFSATVGLAVKWSFAKGADPVLVQEAQKHLLKNRPETVINDFRACDLYDRRPDVGRIALPVLAVCGLQDKMTPPALSEFLNRQIPGSKLELIDQAGHMVLIEQPARLNQAILEFARGL